jgi:hypothetical protein
MPIVCCKNSFLALIAPRIIALARRYCRAWLDEGSVLVNPSAHRFPL